MDKRKQPQGSISGVVESSVHSVWQAMLDHGFSIPDSDKQALNLHSEAAPFTFTIGKPGSGKIHFEIDKIGHQIAVQGEWWYRGITSVAPVESGAIITYQIYNIAPGFGWWLAQYVQCRASLREMETSFTDNLSLIGKNLGCRAYLKD